MTDLPTTEMTDDKRLRTQRFSEEVQRLNLCYTCNDCIHVDLNRPGCSLLYPSQELFDARGKLFNERGDLVFCKYFELT